MSDKHQTPHFSFKVRDLGRLAEADVEVKPLTLFVGENNSGKSYLATLVWGLYQAPLWNLVRDANLELKTQLDGLFFSWLNNLFNIDEKEPSYFRAEVEATAELPQPVVEMMQELGQQAAAALPEMLFRTDTVCPTIELSARPAHPRVRISNAPQDDDIVDVTLWWSSDGGEVVHAMWEPGAADFFTTTGLAYVCGYPLPTRHFRRNLSTPSFPEALFFPASRTGYVHLLPEVVRRLFSTQISRPRQPTTELLPSVTAPVVQFLSFLADSIPFSSTAPSSDLAAYLEEKVLQGRIHPDPAGVGGYLLTPTGTDLNIPMGRSSAVASELVPLLTLLKRDRRHASLPHILIYEEPEAHLHPRLQRILAQVLVRLVNRGVKVLITTHSDTFVQQINDFVKLYSARKLNPDAPALASLNERYTQEDGLSPDDVAAYEFRFREDGRTVAHRLPVSEHGLDMPMFNDELARLTEEVLALEAALGEEE